MSIQTLFREIRDENALFSMSLKSDKEVLHIVPLLINKYFRTGMIQLLFEEKGSIFGNFSFISLSFTNQIILHLKGEIIIDNIAMCVEHWKVFVGFLFVCGICLKKNPMWETSG